MNSIKKIKKFVIGLIGTTILFLGILMIALPGPAFIFIPLGIAVLATEFLWAKKLLLKFRKKQTRI
jgi:uncharacterized protein (TIGR02611 family)